MIKTLEMILFLLFLISAVSCKDSSQNKTYVEGDIQTLDKLTTGLTSIAKNMSPKALRVSLGVNLIAGDPCAAFTGVDPFRNFLSCQPTLLGIYIGQASIFVEEVAFLLEEINDRLNLAEDGTSGSITTDEGDKISYSKIDQDTFDIEVSGEGKRLATLSADGVTVSFKMDGWYIDDADQYSSDFGVYQGNVTFDGEENWAITLFLSGLPCDARAVDSPERMKLIVNYIDNIWTGKAMTFHPRKSKDSCETSPNSSKMNIFTDFVGTLEATKASVYMMNHEVSNLSKIDDYQIGKFCVNYPKICNSGTDYTQDDDPVTIPFCITKPGSNPGWGETCSDERVAKASYLSEKYWILPSQFFLEPVPVM